ncbi:MAG: hypothetical protein ABIB71_04250 [Candidatus Woesearchaeota archaeon]
MDKRGQIYILVALVLSIVIYSLVQVANSASQENLESDFESIALNFEEESSKMINSMIANGKTEEEISEAFTGFSIKFASYARTVNPGYGLLFIFKNSTGVTVGNYLDLTDDGEQAKATIVFENWGQTWQDQVSLPGCYSNIPAGVSFDDIEGDFEMLQEILGDCLYSVKRQPAFEYPGIIDINLECDGECWYSFYLDENKPYEVFSISWEKHGEQRKVYTSGKGGERSGGEWH